MTRITQPSTQETSHPARLDIEMDAHESEIPVSYASLLCAITIDRLFTIAAAGLGLSVAAVQLANREDSLDTTAERLAVATTALSCGVICGAGNHLRNAITDPELMTCPRETGYELAKLTAMGLGAASSALVLSNPELNAADATHQALAKATLALVAISLITSVLRCSAFLHFQRKLGAAEIDG